ncbi:hypothetical protein [Kaistia nematophila]|uniref:Terminase small subunit n=1 Tax=Kaistia nematophila TaxID=2994654 RepID=A0A9X3E6Q3_9HYPH|nr:hypothetical protein [Kaistia nematophila]MCX5572322.1 hypothetical protein [Kaistia nematophila]
MPELTLDQWAAVRVAYETSALPLRDIAAQHGVSHVAVAKRAERQGWLRPGEAPPLPDEAASEKLVARLYRTFEKQVAELELRFASGEGGVEEKDARTLSVLARTLETLAKLREGKEDDAGAAPVDIDALRARLQARLEQLDAAGEAAGAPAGGFAAGGDRGLPA